LTIWEKNARILSVKLNNQPQTKMKNKIDQIVETLRIRGENPEYIISYLTKIISGLEAVAPKPVKGYLDVTIHNMTPVKTK
jgi:hypothetical protein